MAGVAEAYFGAESLQPIATLDRAALFLSDNDELFNFYDTQRKRIQKFADSYLQDRAKPVVTLISAGSTTTTPQVAATRRGFQDFRRMQILVQAWKTFNDTEYRDHAMQMILDWADINVPNGHPINQTHFEGLHYALKDLAPDGTPGQFTPTDYNTRVKPWLEAIRDASVAWGFPPEPGGGTLLYGNHYTHHYMQLYMCYRSLGDTTSASALLTTIDTHATENFPFGNSAITYPDVYAVTALNQGSKWYEITGNFTSRFTTGITFNIVSSTGNNGLYTCSVNSTFVSGKTRITVSESIPSAVADGSVSEIFQTPPHQMPRAATDVGESIDFIRRDSFHYHTYDVQPWLTLAIAEGTSRYQTLMEDAWDWWWTKVLDVLDLHTEFTNSSDDFDQLRWLGSRSEYLQPGTFWIPDEAARTICLYYLYQLTLNPSYPVNDALLAMALRSDRISTEWAYWFRFILGV
jgi:hypothetical protein